MRPVRASPLRSSASRHSAPRACRPGRQPVLRDQHRGLTPTRRCLVMSQDVGCRCFGGMGLAPVPPAQPHRKSHDRQYVEEPRDRRPRQVDVAGVHCIEERSERRQQRPQDQRAAGLRERLCVDDAEAGEEEQLASTHPVADVVEPVQDRSAGDARHGAVRGRVWMNPRKKTVSKTPTTSAITSSGTQSTGAGRS